MAVYQDVDVILKLASFNLLTELQSCYEFSFTDSYVLSSARFTIESKRFVALYGGDAVSRATEYIHNSNPITEYDSDRYAAFDGVVGIDPGEQILFSAPFSTSDCCIITHDKRAIRAVVATPALMPVATKLEGRIICLEQVLLHLFDTFDFEHIKRWVVAAGSQDGVIRKAFPKGMETREKISRLALQRFLDDLKGDAGQLLKY